MDAQHARLSGRVALVTGASSGLGEAIAAALAADGATVVGGARRFADGLAVPLAAGAVTTVHLDVTDEAQVARRFVEIGPVDIVVNAAGVGWFAPVVDASVADLRAMLDVHVVGSFLCARELLRQPKPAHVRHIINVSSVAALRAFTSCAGYTAAKEGQRGLSRVLTEEARAHDVRVTSLLPGATDTPIWDSRAGFDRGKMLRPADVAALVVELVARPALAVEELLVMPPSGSQ